METGTAAANVVSHPAALSVGAAKTFIVAHPVGVAIVGGVLIGAATYYVMKKIFGGKQAESTTTA